MYTKTALFLPLLHAIILKGYEKWGHKMENRKFADKKDIFIVLFIFFAAALALFAIKLYPAPQKDEALFAVVTVKNEEVLCFDLSKYKQYTYLSLSEEYGVPVNFVLEDNKIRFAEVTCPDHTCENYGFIGGAGEIAVCLPNKTSVAIYYKSELPQKFLADAE